MHQRLVGVEAQGALLVGFPHLQSCPIIGQHAGSSSQLACSQTQQEGLPSCNSLCMGFRPSMGRLHWPVHVVRCSSATSPQAETHSMQQDGQRALPIQSCIVCGANPTQPAGSHLFPLLAARVAEHLSSTLPVAPRGPWCCTGVVPHQLLHTSLGVDVISSSPSCRSAPAPSAL